MLIYQNEVYEAESGGNGGGGGEGGNANAAEAAFKRLLEKNNNDGVRVAEKLFDENYQYRKQIRDLEKQVTDTQGKIPAAGAIILTGDEAATYQAYQAYGKPEEIKQALDERASLQGKLATKERESLLRDVADTVGYKPTVLANLDRFARADGKELGYEIRDAIAADGKPAKAVYVREGDKELSIQDYASTHWTDYMPVLAPQATQVSTQTQGTRHVTQHAGSAAVTPKTTKEIAQTQLDKAYKPKDK